MIIRRLIAPLTAAFVQLHAGQAGAQDASPAPLPNQSAAPPANASPFPPVNNAPAVPSPFPWGGAAPSVMGGGFGAPPRASEFCMKDFTPLREEAEKRGKLIKAASERKAPPDEACKLITNFGQAEIQMIKYVEANSARCGILSQVADQLKAGHKNTDALLQKVCSVAQRMRRGPHGPVQINDIGDPAMEDPHLFQISPSKKSGPTSLE